MPDAACNRLPLAAATEQAALPSGLVLVSTPLGNLADMTFRAVATLKNADLVLCEDTRVTRRLLGAYGVKAPLASLHEHNEDARIPQLLAMLGAGKRLALVSDAGTPLVSDPGYRLVRAALAGGLPVGAVPGPNAVVMALVLSGLPPQPFLFMGFPPPRGESRRRAFARLRAAERAGLTATVLWHEAPHRLAATLADLAVVFGPRQAAVARELTKKFEEVRRGDLAELAAQYAAVPARGEITLVVAPAPADAGESVDAADLDARLGAAMASVSLRDAVGAVRAATGRPRKLVYARAMALRRTAQEP
jgi:16S rRNA (cytidine1402-2'-O)-methyltransferase